MPCGSKKKGGGKKPPKSLSAMSSPLQGCGKRY